MATDQQGELLGRWRELLPANDDLGTDLLRRYAQAHRAYHTQAHLAQLLDMIDQLSDGTEDLVAVRLAAWFHDAVYAVPTDPEVPNEEASAQLARAELMACGIAADTAAEVERLVRLTATHDPAPDDAAGALLCDADMSILAATPADYRRYTDAIRQEYRHLDDKAFARGRLDFITSTLGRPIFHTVTGARLGQQAASNLAAERRLLQT